MTALAWIAATILIAGLIALFLWAVHEDRRALQLVIDCHEHELAAQERVIAHQYRTITQQRIALDELHAELERPALRGNPGDLVIIRNHTLRAAITLIRHLTQEHE